MLESFNLLERREEGENTDDQVESEDGLNQRKGKTNASFAYSIQVTYSIVWWDLEADMREEGCPEPGRNLSFENLTSG